MNNDDMRYKFTGDKKPVKINSTSKKAIFVITIGLILFVVMMIPAYQINTHLPVAPLPTPVQTVPIVFESEMYRYNVFFYSNDLYEGNVVMYMENKYIKNPSRDNYDNNEYKHRVFFTFDFDKDYGLSPKIHKIIAHDIITDNITILCDDMIIEYETEYRNDITIVRVYHTRYCKVWEIK